MTTPRTEVASRGGAPGLARPRVLTGILPYFFVRWGISSSRIFVEVGDFFICAGQFFLATSAQFFLRACGGYGGEAGPEVGGVCDGRHC